MVCRKALYIKGRTKLPAWRKANIIRATMTSHLTRQKHAEERLGAALQQMNDAIRNVHKTGIDVDISTLTIHTPRGPMVQVDLKTFRPYGAPTVLRLVDE